MSRSCTVRRGTRQEAPKASRFSASVSCWRFVPRSRLTFHADSFKTRTPMDPSNSHRDFCFAAHDLCGSFHSGTRPRRLACPNRRCPQHHCLRADHPDNNITCNADSTSNACGTGDNSDNGARYR
jgi:hypothetical protein